MLTRELVARPTEYRGVRFRSKTEAVFALAIEQSNFVWEYEPRLLKLADGWVPDFWIVDAHTNLRGVQAISSFLIELKPRPVTQTYKDELAKRVASMKPYTRGHTFALVTGSPFDQTVTRTVEIFHRDKWYPNIQGLVNRFCQYWDAASRNRFDLIT